MKKDDITIILSCAGMGTRLGIGTTKALVEINGKTILERQLELLKDFKDIRITVGYQAEKVIEVVNNIRKDVMFIFNYDYKHTGNATNFCKSLIGANEYVIEIEGDLLINAEDLKNLVEYSGECIGGTSISSDEPVYMCVECGLVRTFSLNNGNKEWMGLAKIKTEHFTKKEGNIYEILETLLPLPFLEVRARNIDIDTPEDYDKVLKWYKSGCLD
ncbi:bifunctional N-acetylglucosamine-1-phosphate uridyltransferase/glucosamine-1-phosphate acetyltransferase [uncultured Clostridium sp.]|nr:bifunctional N-acetylglucosamine-1-phosphate uridyltransferase/glucosamine-1-phosphate acetyltransferase [uncultured Clostridium sp.]